MKNVIKAVEISRPLLWLNTSMPLLWGILATRGAVQPSDLVLFAFFLFPYNYFLHAPNDYFDFETDARNPRKGGVEGALTPKPRWQRSTRRPRRFEGNSRPSTAHGSSSGF